MPQELTMVFLKETGEPMLMHSVDAAEAMCLGDYVSLPPGEKGLSPEDQAMARGQALRAMGPVHPEMMSVEQRDALRAEANRLEVQRLELLKLPVPAALQAAVDQGAKLPHTAGPPHEPSTSPAAHRGTPR
jgi:hypothetical protein